MVRHHDAGDAAPGPALTAPSTTVLQRAGEQALASGHSFLDHEALEHRCRADALGHDELFASLRSLERAGLVDMHFVQPSRVTLLRLTDRGIRRYLAATRPDLAEVRRRLLAVLAAWVGSDRAGAAVDMARAVEEPILVVEVLMEDLQREGRLIFSRAIGGRVRVHRFEPEPD